MIPKAFLNQKEQKKKHEQSNQIKKDEFIFGQGKVPEYNCTLCGKKAWYIGLTTIYCSNEGCKWYYNPHKENENDTASSDSSDSNSS